VCGRKGHVSDCLAVLHDGFVLEKVMERMVRRLSQYVGEGMVLGVRKFCSEYSITLRPADEQRVLSRVLGTCMRVLFDELAALAPRNLKNKIESTNKLLAEDRVVEQECQAPPADPEPEVEDMDHECIGPSAGS